MHTNEYEQKYEGACCHGHDHDHAHEHNHEGDCCHGHSHTHEDNANSPDETLALLTYMLEHNRHHEEDLHEIYHSLEDNGKADAAALLRDAMHDFGHANDKLENALKLLK